MLYWVWTLTPYTIIQDVIPSHSRTECDSSTRSNRTWFLHSRTECDSSTRSYRTWFLRRAVQSAIAVHDHTGRDSFTAVQSAIAVHDQTGRDSFTQPYMMRCHHTSKACRIGKWTAVKIWTSNIYRIWERLIGAFRLFSMLFTTTILTTRSECLSNVLFVDITTSFF